MTTESESPVSMNETLENSGQSPPQGKRPGFFSWRRRAVCKEEKSDNPDSNEGGISPQDPASVPDEHRRHRWHRHFEHRREKWEKFGPGYDPKGEETGHHGDSREGPRRHQFCKAMWDRYGDYMKVEERALFKEFDFQ